MLQNDRTKEKDRSDGVPVHVEGDREVLLIKRRGRWRALFVALWLPALTGCTTLAGPQVQGAAVRVQLSNGQPLDVIVIGGGRR